MSASDKPPRDASSELQAGVEQVSKVVGGVLSNLFGTRATGIPRPESPVLGEEADATLRELGATVGRALHAAGQQLEADPAHPARAIERSWADRDTAPALEVEEDDAPLSAGVRTLARGLSRTTEVLLDQLVAPDTGAEE